MEIYASKTEILRQARALLGIQTDSALASQVEEQHVAALSAALLKVQQECKWVNTQRRTTITLQQTQEKIDYPDGGRPGSVQAMAVFDTDRYYPLQPRIIPIHADVDQQIAEGGTALEGVVGRPRYYEQRDQLVVWPPPNKQYPLRIDYIKSVLNIISSQNEVSIVDAQLVIYATCSIVSMQMGDDKQAEYYGRLYSDRKSALMAWQSQGSTFPMSTEADLGEDEVISDTLIPQWDRNPTTRQGP